MEENQKNKKSGVGKKATKFLVKKLGKVFWIKFWAIVSVILLAFLLIVGAITSFQSTTSNKGSSGELVGGGAKALSPNVLKWQSVVEKYAKKYEVPQLIPYILAIIQVETGGTSKDLMQSSESLGLPVNTLGENESIEQGVKYLKQIMEMMKKNGGEEDLLGAVQAYNYGSNYVNYLSKNKVKHDLETAENYSKNVVAPSLGNSTGQRYSYVNEVSTKMGKTYLYLNGGNFFYSYLVLEFLGGGGGGAPINPSKFYSEMKKEMEKYSGRPYVWGGKDPINGFDCSGLTGYLYSKILGIDISTYTVSQYENSVAVSLSEAKSGDLIFFRGTYGSPDFISHVGIFVNKTTMFDANGSGTGYHDWSNSYWMSHSPEIRRVK